MSALRTGVPRDAAIVIGPDGVRGVLRTAVPARVVIGRDGVRGRVRR